MSKIISALAFATVLSLPASAAVNPEVTAPRILVTNASATCPANEGYGYNHSGDYRIWPGPNCNTFTATVLRAVPELETTLPSNAVGKDFRAYPYSLCQNFCCVRTKVPNSSGFQPGP